MNYKDRYKIMEENRYLLTMMVAERAEQLLAGAKPLIKTKFKNPVSIALEEIKEGKVYLNEHKDSEGDSFKSIFLV